MKYLFSVLIINVLLNFNLLSQTDGNVNYEFALIEASRQKTIGNVNEAIKLYKKCIEVKPQSPAPYYELGSIYAALNEPEISREYLKRAYTLNSDNYYYLLAYNQILTFFEDYPEIIRISRKYLKDHEDVRVYYSISNAYFKSGKYRRALKELNNIEKEKGISEQIILKKVEILKDQKKYEKAEKELMKLWGIMPEAPEYNIILAEFYEETDQMNKALVYYENAYEIDSTNIYAISNLADYYTQNGPPELGLYYLNRAFTLEEVKLEKKLSTMLYFMGKEELLKDYSSEYEKIVTTLRKQYPDNQDVKTLAYDFYTRMEDSEESYVIIRELVNENRENFMLWQQAIYTASLLEKYDDIISLGKEAKGIFPNKRELNLFIGIAYFQKEVFDTSYHFLYEGYEPGMAMGTEIQFLTFLGESAYKIGKTEESFYYFEELLLLQPDNYMVMNNYSYYMALENRTLARAEELSRKTIEKFPDNATYLDTYAWILFKMGKYQEAKDFINKISTGDIDDPDIFIHKAWIACKLNERFNADTFFKRAIDLGYDNSNDIDRFERECGYE